MTEQHQGQPEPNRTEQQITREELEKEVDTGQQEEDATDEGMPEAPATGKEAPVGSGGAPIPGGTGMPGDEGAPGTGDQNAQQGHTPTV